MVWRGTVLLLSTIVYSHAVFTPLARADDASGEDSDDDEDDGGGKRRFALPLPPLSPAPLAPLSFPIF